MGIIKRSAGFTKSESFLASLADHTFLDLWSYPNVFGRPGKELCDLLVVCGDDVIIFSDKSIEWTSEDVKIAWPRWYKRAIGKSVAQIRGAERWLRLNPAEIFLDAQCTRRLPLELPPIDHRRVHGICVAFGAEAACREHFEDDDGTFLVYPHMKGNQHIDFDVDDHLPFAVGDVNPGGPFVHVFDQSSLEIVMRELDTISDFTEYLNAREPLIRNDLISISLSEADMVANYMLTVGPDGHRFPTAADFGASPDTLIAFAQGEYAALTASPEYQAKKEADKDSYVWDRLIKVFTGPVLDGTTAPILGEPSVKLSERGLRFMARESRLSRRILGWGIADALNTFPHLGKDRFARIFPSSVVSSNVDLAYVFMILDYPRGGVEGGYIRYRQVRVSMLETYCMAVFQEYPHYKKVVGIAIDGPSRKGGSEELMAFEAPDWSQESLEMLAERRATYQILEVDKLKVTKTHVKEYPVQFTNNPGLNRHERRKAAKQACHKR